MTTSAPRSHAVVRARVSPARRAVAALAWVTLWMLAWGAALMLFAVRAHAAPLSLAVSDGPVSLPIYVADARGFFKAAGVDVSLRACRSGRDCYRLLADASVDVATASDLLVAIGAATRRDIAIIGTISTSSYQIKIVARRGPQMFEAPQMRGKRIGTVVGSSAQYFLDNWLVFNDIDPRTVTVVALAPDHVVAALEHREVDAISIWEPLAASAGASLAGEAVTFASPRVYTQHFNLVTDRAVIARREPDMVAVLKALIRAQRFIADEPAAATALLAARLNLSPAVAAASLADQDFRIRLDQSLVTTMQSQARWAAQAGLDKTNGSATSVDLLRAIEPGPLRQAAPEAIGLAH